MPQSGKRPAKQAVRPTIPGVESLLAATTPQTSSSFANPICKLPLTEAYTFGEKHSLGHKITEIRTIQVKAPLSNMASSARRGYVIELFESNGLFQASEIPLVISGSLPAGRAERQRCVSVNA